jgi:hypothetical protein
MDFNINFTDKEITPWGVMVLLRRMSDATGLKKAVSDNKDLPVPGSNRGYAPGTIIYCEHLARRQPLYAH